VIRLVLRAGCVAVLAALLAGTSAHARTPYTGDRHARPAYGYTTNEWLMMGPHCGASSSAL
jgi:hypothetical protein